MTEENFEITSQLAELTKKVAHLEDNLLLVADVYRFEKLRDYLASGDFFEADLATVQVILDVAGKSEIEELSPEDISQFPANELKVLDRLWRKYSDERFGFSVQLKIYKNVGGTLETTIAKDQKIVEQWGERLGWRQKNQWRKCDELDYSLSAPIGCHPSQWWNSPYGSKMTNYFLARLINSNL